MNISWLGHSCFKIETKYQNQNLVIITDPYHKEIGLRVPKMAADIVTISHEHDDHNNREAVEGNLEKTPFLIDQPGEYEIKGVFVHGLSSSHDNQDGAQRGGNIIYRFDIEGLSLVHLGDLGHQLSDQQLDQLGNVDVLFVPVGGTYTLDANGASKLVREIEPRLVIPMHYRDDKVKLKLDSVNAFRKEMGGQATTEKKIKIAAKNLPAEETKIIILEK
ncbi:MAG: MBL fold metallo-hydrolase [Patescibacteria group bacterium]